MFIPARNAWDIISEVLKDNFFMSEVNQLRLRIKNFVNIFNRVYGVFIYIFPVMNYAAFDINVGAFRKFQGEKGISDLILVAFGITYYVELKVGDDRQSKDQKLFEQNIRKAGAVYVLVKTFEQFTKFFFGTVIKDEHHKVYTVEQLRELAMEMAAE